MQYWLVKTEPDTYSYNDLLEKETDMWDGVRNYQARNNLKSMKAGDKVLVYHSGKHREIVGLANVVREHYPDPTTDDDRWVAVNLMAEKKLEKPVTLEEIKAQDDLSDMTLLRNSRLSVMPVSQGEFEKILTLSEL